MNFVPFRRRLIFLLSSTTKCGWMERKLDDDGLVHFVCCLKQATSKKKLVPWQNCRVMYVAVESIITTSLVKIEEVT